MFYTLSTWAVWMAGAALIGAVVGWMLRSVRPRVVTVIKEVTVDGTPQGARRPAAVSADTVPSLLLGETLPSDHTVELERTRSQVDSLTDEVDALAREVAAWRAEAERQTTRAVTAERYVEAATADWQQQLEAARAASATSTPAAVPSPVIVARPAAEPDEAVRAERDHLAHEVVTLRAAVQELRVRLWNADAQIAALRDGSPGA